MPSRISGKVVSISETGDAITDLAHDQLADVPQDDRTSIECGGHTTLGIYPADHDQPEMTYVAILGGSGCLELSLIGDSAAKFLGLKVNDEVTIKWQSGHLAPCVLSLAAKSSSYDAQSHRVA